MPVGAPHPPLPRAPGPLCHILIHKDSHAHLFLSADKFKILPSAIVVLRFLTVSQLSRNMVDFIVYIQGHEVQPPPHTRHKKENMQKQEFAAPT